MSQNNIFSKYRLSTQNTIICQNLGIAGKCRRDFTTKSSGFAYTGDDFWKMGFVGPDPRKNSLGASRCFVDTGSDFLSCGSLLGFCFPNYFSKSTEGLSNIEVSELSRGFPGSRGSGGSKRAPDPPFHSRRRQDDVSSNKLSQITGVTYYQHIDY